MPGNRQIHESRTWLAVSVLATIVLGALPACHGKPVAGELASRESLKTVEGAYRPDGRVPDLPTIHADSPLHDYLLFAMLNNPSVEAAYHDWAASVERITTSRSLPDPRLTFESDIADSVMSVMPGFMMAFPGPGKLKASGQIAVAESSGTYFAFEQQVLRTANAIKTAYYRIAFLEQRLAIERESLELLGDLEELAREQNAAGRVTLQDVLRAQIERERLQIEIENLEDSRTALVAEFKAALGLRPDDVDPPIPASFQRSDDSPSTEEIWRVAIERNPQLQRMRADVAQAQASIELARRAAVPDLELGVAVDVKASPLFARPQAAVSLPIWRDKIEAEIAAAQARRSAAEARLNAEQIALAAELATLMYMYRESSRNIALLDERIVPKALQSLEAARAGYVSGKADFLDLIDAQRSVLDFQTALAEALTQRELSLSALTLLIAGTPPQGAPILPPERAQPTSASPIHNKEKASP